jgi:hypothetical protein
LAVGVAVKAPTGAFRAAQVQLSSNFPSAPMASILHVSPSTTKRQ